MKRIKLHNTEIFALVSDEDFDHLSQYTWRYNRRNHRPLTSIKVNGKWVSKTMHRLILPPKKGLDIDHINRDTMDNRRENLRYATRSQNHANSPARKPSFKGVYETPAKHWRTSIKPDGVLYRLGTFKNALDAAIAYDMAALMAFGEFAWTNVLSNPYIPQDTNQ